MCVVSDDGDRAVTCVVLLLCLHPTGNAICSKPLEKKKKKMHLIFQFLFSPGLEKSFSASFHHFYLCFLMHYALKCSLKLPRWQHKLKNIYLHFPSKLLQILYYIVCGESVFVWKKTSNVKCTNRSPHIFKRCISISELFAPPLW